MMEIASEIGAITPFGSGRCTERRANEITKNINQCGPMWAKNVIELIQKELIKELMLTNLCPYLQNWYNCCNLFDECYPLATWKVRSLKKWLKKDIMKATSKFSDRLPEGLDMVRVIEECPIPR